MQIKTTPLSGVYVIEPDVFEDSRGFFMEIHRQPRYAQQGIEAVFVQDNLSFSCKGTLRGLHFQRRNAQAKLVQAVTGEVYDVAVDLRPESVTFGRWHAEILSQHNRRQMYIPEGFAHGFCVLSDCSHFLYKCSDTYHPEDEGGLLWSDPDIGIEWPLKDPLLSPKDRDNPTLAELGLKPRHTE